MKKKNKYSSNRLFWIFAILTAMLITFGVYQKTMAFSGACSMRDGTMNQECLDANKSRLVTMTYAKDLPSYYRFSRSGSSWTNHVNREYTKSYRSDDNRGSQILTQYSSQRITGYQRRREEPLEAGQSTSTEAALYQKALQRRKEAKAFMTKYE